MKAYLSYLRIFSTFSVIVLHVAAIYVMRFEKYPLTIWKISNMIDSSVRFCVPVFLMISGALLLNKEENLSFFLKRRFKRIVIPFLFWWLVYFFYNYWDFIRSESFVSILAKAYFGFMRGISYHFWYVYLILGLYLFVPVLRRWTVRASKNELHYFLGIWLLTLFINPENPYFPKIELMYFSKYIGYLVLGFYISELKIQSVFRTRIIALVFFISGVLLTYFLTLHYTAEQYKFDRFFYEYLSPTVMLTAIGIFLFFKTLDFRANHISILIDKNTFGIYLVHLLILEIIVSFTVRFEFLNNPFLFFLYVVIISLLVFWLSYFCILLLSKVPFLKKIVT